VPTRNGDEWGTRKSGERPEDNVNTRTLKGRRVRHPGKEKCRRARGVALRYRME